VEIQNQRVESVAQVHRCDDYTSMAFWYQEGRIPDLPFGPTQNASHRAAAPIIQDLNKFHAGRHMNPISGLAKEM